MNLRNAIEQLTGDESLRSNLKDFEARPLINAAIAFLYALDEIGMSLDTAFDGLKDEVAKANALRGKAI